MNAGSFDNFPHDKREDENDPVWNLLARSPRPEPDAWFAARTLARCRNEGAGVDSTAWFFHLTGIWRWALGGGLALSLALALVVTQVQTQNAEKQKNVQEAFEIMASMDTDTDSSSSTSSSWQDSSL